MITSFLLASTFLSVAFSIYLYITKSGLEIVYEVASSGWRHYQENHQLQVSINIDLQKEMERMLLKLNEAEFKLETNRSHYLGRMKELKAELEIADAQVNAKQAIINGYELSPITSIKFTANVPTSGWLRTEFKLGKGPCGKEVIAIHWVEKDDRYELTQACTGGERKEFIYYKKDVEGRIEIAYKANATH